MGKFKLKAASECRFDILSLGEVMLRLDPHAYTDPDAEDTKKGQQLS